VLWDVSKLCAVAPPPGLYGVVGTGVLTQWVKLTAFEELVCFYAPSATLSFIDTHPLFG
jgi:hypothetical protein